MNQQPGETVVQIEPDPGQEPHPLGDQPPSHHSSRKPRDAASTASSTSSDDSDDSKHMLRERRPNQYIPMDYEDMLQMLGKMVDGQKPEDWAMHWRMLFGVNLPLYANVRTADIFKPLIEQYEDLDPTPKTIDTPPVAAVAAPPGGVDDDQDDSSSKAPSKKLSDGIDALAAMQAPLCGERTRAVPILHRGFAGPAQPPAAAAAAAAGSAEGFREDSLDALLQMCGFQEVPKEFIKEAAKEEGKKGLNVHVPPAKELPTRVYYRGLVRKEDKKPRWQTFCCCCGAGTEVQKVFMTLVFVYSYNYQPEDAPDNCCSKLCWLACNEARRRAVGPAGSEGKVFMHAYNSIALPDMDMLWPASKPNPTFFDVVSILVPLLVALGSSLWKLIGLMADVDDLSDTANLLVILFAIVTPFTVAFRYFMKAKNKYYLYKARHADTVVRHTHSTNRGTLSSLLEDATDQECKEIMLAYTMLAIAPKPLTIDGLRSAANSVLRRISDATPGIDYNVDFDAEDPVRDLDTLGLLVRHEGGGLGVQDLQAAKRAISLKRFEQQMEKRARARLAEMRETGV